MQDQDSRRALRIPLRHLVSEQQRSVAETAFFHSAAPHLRFAPDEPRTVLLIPGLLASDQSVAAFGRALRRQGHRVYRAGLPRYLDWSESLGRQLAERLAYAHAGTERPVSVVGWSAGGILARELARTHPDVVEQVISIGSPFRYRTGDPSVIAAAIHHLRPGTPPSVFEAQPPEDERPPIAQPVTSIYSRTDGIAGWRQCLQSPGRFKENIEIWGSHTGMSRNVAVLIAVSDRLARPTSQWRPFRAPRGTVAFFPTTGRGE